MERIGVVDIGSNTVRLVVYDIASRLPVPMFNEKASCRLGAGLPETGLLNPHGVKQAIGSIDRFVRLSRAMSVDAPALVATAAVRDAEDGADFAGKIEALCGLPVEILSGEEEARLAALGVMNGVPDANGVVCDLGGGSLDLVRVADGRCSRQTSLPFGHLRLHEIASGRPEKARGLVAAAIRENAWPGDTTGHAIYAVGGSIRTLARLNIAQTAYPLHIVDNYTMRQQDARGLVELVANLSPDTLRRIPGVPSRRAETLPMAAVVLDALLEAFTPRQVVFSGFGMREGKMISMLPETHRRHDPLIAACSVLEPRSGRFSLSGVELEHWMSPLFRNTDQRARRNRLAACLLSDIGWHEHPDYRAEHAFYRVLRLPFAGLEHRDRIFLAVAIHVRYGGHMGDEQPGAVLPWVGDDVRDAAEITGLALRLGHRLAGSAPGLLETMPLQVIGNTLRLSATGTGTLIRGEAVERPLKNLARALDMDFEIDVRACERPYSQSSSSG